MNKITSYPCWDSKTKKYIETPIADLAPDYINNQIRYHESRLDDSIFFLNLLKNARQ